MLVWMASAWAQTAPPIVNGEKTTDFPEVGALVMYSKNYGGAAFCSGTLIHPEWVVTAAHCSDAAKDYERQGWTIYFVLTSDVSRNWDIYQEATEIVSNPQYKNGSDPGSDVGLLQLAEPITEQAPMPVHLEEVDRTWIGEMMDFVGFGVTKDNGNDSGVKRTAQIPVSEVRGGILYAYDPNGKNLCSGDSGGPGLKAQEDGSYQLISINSFVYGVGSSSTSCVKGGSGSALLSYNAEFMAQYVDLSEASEPFVPPIDIDDTGTLPERPSEAGVAVEAPGACSSVPGRSAALLAVLVGLGLGLRRR